MERMIHSLNRGFVVIETKCTEKLDKEGRKLNRRAAPRRVRKGALREV